MNYVRACILLYKLRRNCNLNYEENACNLNYEENACNLNYVENDYIKAVSQRLEWEEKI